MRPRSRSDLASIIASLALLVFAAPATGYGPGTTFLTGGLELPAGAIAGGQSGYGGAGADRSGVSRDGRYVAFVSEADTLDAAAHPDAVNVYRKDRLTGEVVLASRMDGAEGAALAASSSAPAISDDGDRVAFLTTGALDPADTDGGAADVYVRDVAAGTTVLATPGTAADVGPFDLSGNGGFVAFATADALSIADIGNARMDVYLRNLGGGTTTLVSVGTTSLAGNRASTEPSVSDDGTWVAFVSSATDLVAGYRVGSGSQVFARDMTARATSLVSATAADAARGGNGASSAPDVAGAPASAARSRVLVAYTSAATDLGTGDASSETSIYRRTLSVTTGSLLVSRADGAAGADANDRSYWPSISDDGSVVTFTSEATNLGGSYGGAYPFGVFLRNVGANRTLLASTDDVYAVQSAISDDGAFLAWVNGGGVTPDSDPDLYGVFGRAYAAPSTLGAAELVSRPAGGAPFLSTWIEVDPPDSGKRVVGGDGRYVVFKARTSRLPGGRAGGPGQIYRRDLATGEIQLVSRATGADGAAADGYVSEPSISADGSRVAFVSFAQLDPAHTDGTGQVYVRNLAAGTTTLVSRADGPAGALPNDDASYPAISPDGTHVAFATAATNMGVPGTDEHVYLRDVAAGTTQLVDRANGPAGAPGNGNAELPSLSADGRLVAFGSQASNLDAADPDTFADVYVRDTVAGTTTLLSRRSGLDGQHAASVSYHPAISADGSVVAFEASDETLAPDAGPWGGVRQVVARALATGTNALVSRAPDGAPANADARHPSVSGDGGVVAFESGATNLLAGVGGSVRSGVFARTMATGALSGPPAFGLIGSAFQNRAQYPSISDDGQCMAFDATGHNAATGTAGDGYTTYMHVVSGACPKPLPVPEAPPPSRRVARPRLSSVSLSHRRFRVGRRATAKSAVAARRRRARRAPVGTTFRFALNVRANVAIAIERQAPGRLVGRFCRRPAPSLRRHLRCVRFARVGRISRGGLSAGANRIAFSGRIGRRALKPGRYRARLRATNAGGSSAWAKLAFAVVR